MPIARLDPLSARDLRAICTLAEQRNFHRAASQCQMSQPALSAIVKKVESNLGTKLFIRGPRLFKISSEGEWVIPKIKEALKVLSSVAKGAQARKPLEGPLRFGSIPTIGRYLLPKALPVILKKYPDLNLCLSEATTDVLVEQIIREELDAALVALPLNNPRLVEIPLFEEELLLAAPKSYPGSVKKRVSVSSLADKKLLLMEKGHCLRAQTLDQCAVPATGLRTVQSSALDTLLCMVQTGAGVAMIPEMVAGNRDLVKNIKVFRFASPAPTRMIGIITQKESLRMDDCKLIGEYLNRLSPG